MKKVTLSYAAGVFDVRGSIRVNPTSYDKYGVQYYNPIIRLVIMESKVEVLQFLKHHFGGCISRADYGDKRSKRAWGRLYWQITSEADIVRFCKKVPRFFKNKAKVEECEKLLQFYNMA